MSIEWRLAWMFIAGWCARSLGDRIENRRGGVAVDVVIALALGVALWFGLGG